MTKTIILTDFFGKYGKAAEGIVRSLGYHVWKMDEDEEKVKLADILNYESLIGLPPELFAVWCLSDRANRQVQYISSYTEESFPQVIMTESNMNHHNWSNKRIGPHLPMDNDVIRYPKIIDLPTEEFFLKKNFSSGTTEWNNRGFVHKANKGGITAFEYIPHDREIVLLMRSISGQLMELVFYEGRVTDKWTDMKPLYVPDSKYYSYLLEWAESFCEINWIDGVVDAEFMVGYDSRLWFTESNCRPNGQSYFLAKPMLMRFIKQSLPEEWHTEGMKYIDIDYRNI